MTLPVRWLPEAVREARAARRHYARINFELAQRFTAELKSVEARIAGMP